MNRESSELPTEHRQRRGTAIGETNPARYILAPPGNCWRIEQARRATFLIDGEAYFSAFRAAAMNARRSIFIVGWDIDSRTALVHDDPNDGFPVRLGEFFNTLIQRRRGLDIYILNWDFIMLYAPDRELLPAFKLGWHNRGRMHFHLDDEHPIGASHHQKIVVIDDAVAFVGGLDLSERRWDTNTHSASEQRRCNRNGVSYPPFHDVQMMVDGDAAAALGTLVRERWRRATHSEPRVESSAVRNDPWPVTVTPDLTNAEIAIARTMPNYKAYPAVQEVKQLYLDAIRAARRSIYIENQYLTAHAVGDALEDLLRAPEGPEIVIVSRLRGGGWLERSTMTVLRARLLKRLRGADIHGRLRVYYPDNKDLCDVCIDLHSKLMIVDDRLVIVGSANLNNRSMGFDTECDLAIEAADTHTTREIARLRHRLLAEHLDVDIEKVAHTEQRIGSLITTIETLQGNPRTLKSLTAEIAPEIDALVPDAAVIDPEEPIDPDQLMNEIIPAEAHSSAGMRMTAIAGSLLVIAVLVAAWRWTPLAEWFDTESMMRMAAALRGSPSAWLWVLGGFLVASLTAVPITALIIATVMIYGPVAGFGYALIGSLLGAVLTYGLGQLIGRRAVRRLAGERINRLSRRLGRHGLLAVVVTRLFPVAPFTVVNLVAGASHIRLRDYIIGTILGMVPGMLAITFFSDRLAAVMRDPSPTAFAVLAIALIIIVAGTFVVRAWLKRYNGHNAHEQTSGT